MPRTTDTETNDQGRSRHGVGFEPLVSLPASSFALRLSIAIEREGLLECDVAMRSGIDATQINHFTRGRREPSRANLARILAVLPHTDARWLVCG